MVLVHDTSSRRGLQVYQVSLKNLNGFQVIERTRFVTDRQTDRQTDARGKTICLPTLSGVDIISKDLISLSRYNDGLSSLFSMSWKFAHFNFFFEKLLIHEY